MKSILFVTGSRADFGKLLPLANIAKRSFSVSFFVTGMHMMEEYGGTFREVRRVEGIEFHEYVNQRRGDRQDFILSKTILGFSDWIHEHRPDLVIVHGDRIEALACAVVCATNYVRCAHIEGGEVSGTIDEAFRHSISKMAHAHFTSSPKADSRLLALGEFPSSIFRIGSPELDWHTEHGEVSLQDVKARYEIPFPEYGIVIFHPVTSELSSLAKQAAMFFAALVESGKSFVVIMPNNDPGTEHISAVIDGLPRDRFRIIPSMRFSYFSVLLKNAYCILGNSSTGVREAPFLGIPALNIGTRQSGRSSAASIANAAAHEQNRIIAFLHEEWGQRYKPDYEFGDGTATERFDAAINSEAFWNLPLQKHFCE